MPKLLPGNRGRKQTPAAPGVQLPSGIAAPQTAALDSLGASLREFGGSIAEAGVAADRVDRMAAHDEVVRGKLAYDADYTDFRINLEDNQDYPSHKQAFTKFHAGFITPQLENVNSPEARQELLAYYAGQRTANMGAIAINAIRKTAAAAKPRLVTLGAAMADQAVQTSDPEVRAKRRADYADELVRATENGVLFKADEENGLPAELDEFLRVYDANVVRGDKAREQMLVEADANTEYERVRDSGVPLDEGLKDLNEGIADATARNTAMARFKEHHRLKQSENRKTLNTMLAPGATVESLMDDRKAIRQLGMDAEELSIADEQLLSRMQEIDEGLDIFTSSSVKSALHTEAAGLTPDTEEYEDFAAKVNLMRSSRDAEGKEKPREIGTALADDLIKNARTNFKKAQSTAIGDAISAGSQIVEDSATGLAARIEILRAMESAEEDVGKQHDEVLALQRENELQGDLYDRYIRDIRRMVEEEDLVDPKTIHSRARVLETHYRQMGRRGVAVMEAERALHEAGFSPEDIQTGIGLAAEGADINTIVDTLRGVTPPTPPPSPAKKPGFLSVRTPAIEAAKLLGKMFDKKKDTESPDPSFSFTPTPLFSQQQLEQFIPEDIKPSDLRGLDKQLSQEERDNLLQLMKENKIEEVKNAIRKLAKKKPKASKDKPKLEDPLGIR